MAITLKDFVRGIVESGLMSVDEVRALIEAIPRSKIRPSAETFARQLVQRHVLTSFQAGRLLERKIRGLVLGNNVLLEQIGKGGMGEVFRAEHRRMKRSVVVKVLPESATKSAYLVKRFQREVQAAAQLSHPNIVTAYDADEEDGIYFLVMEYVEGEDLATIVFDKGPLPIATAIDFTLQAARGLEYAHDRGIIHRDIKPDNLLVDRAGKVKILDMGLARIELEAEVDATVANDNLTQANHIIGTVDYMSPEQADDSSRVDSRCDIYSLGCTMYRLLTGQAPFKATSAINTLISHRLDPIPLIQAVRSDATQHLDDIFARMVAKDPDSRYQSMTEVIRDLEACLTEFDFELETPGMPRAGDDAFQPTRDLDRRELAAADAQTRSSADGATVNYEMREPLPHAIRSQQFKQRGKSRTTHSAVGIDLGTTYSAIAVLDDAGRPQTVLNAEGDKITPSVVLFDGDEIVVGKEAVKALSTDMEMIARCIKREMGEQFFHQPIGAEQFPPEVLGGWILKKLHDDASEQIGDFTKVVITVPAYFDETRRKATQDAGYIAGLDVVEIINEPTAAAIAVGFQQGRVKQGTGDDLFATTGKTQKVLVYDLGGGTFDVTVMEIGDGEFKTLATDGDVLLGGYDWDFRLLNYVAEEFTKQHGADPRSDPSSVGRLWRECEEAKHTLSVRKKVHVSCDFGGKSSRVPITRDMFEEITADLLDRTSFTTNQTLAAANLTWDDIDRVLMVGGSTRMPAVIESIRKLSGKEPDRSVSPDETVAHGAALMAGRILERDSGVDPKLGVTNVNSHSLGIVGTDLKTKQKQNNIIIPRNTPLPATAKKKFHTSKPGQRSIKIQIVEGENPNPADCSQVGRCTISDLPPDLPAKTPIEVVFHYEENGRLLLTVDIPGADKQLVHEISRTNRLTKLELDQWKKSVCGEPAEQPAPIAASEKGL